MKLAGQRQMVVAAEIILFSTPKYALRVRLLRWRRLGGSAGHSGASAWVQLLQEADRFVGRAAVVGVVGLGRLRRLVGRVLLRRGYTRR